jgi:hypothetical protein
MVAAAIWEIYGVELLPVASYSTGKADDAPGRRGGAIERIW